MICSLNEGKMQSILVVDDDIGACMIMQRMVQLRGFDCDVAYDGDAAVAAASVKKYSLILLDSYMPSKNGWDTAQEILSRRQGSEPQIIGMITTDEPLLRQKCKDAGMRVLLQKPVNRDALNKSIGLCMPVPSDKTRIDVSRTVK